MVDTQLLDDRIDDSGKKIAYLADKMGITVQAFRMKRKNLSEFTSDQVAVLCDELDIKKLTDKEKIFFKRK
jgi:hypothetical protein